MSFSYVVQHDAHTRLSWPLAAAKVGDGEDDIKMFIDLEPHHAVSGDDTKDSIVCQFGHSLPQELVMVVKMISRN